MKDTATCFNKQKTTKRRARSVYEIGQRDVRPFFSRVVTKPTTSVCDRKIASRSWTLREQLSPYHHFPNAKVILRDYAPLRYRPVRTTSQQRLIKRHEHVIALSACQEHASLLPLLVPPSGSPNQAPRMRLWLRAFCLRDTLVFVAVYLSGWKQSERTDLNCLEGCVMTNLQGGGRESCV